MQTNLETINAIISKGKSLLQGLILALPLAESQHLPSESSQLQLSLHILRKCSYLWCLSKYNRKSWAIAQIILNIKEDNLKSNDFLVGVLLF